MASRVLHSVAAQALLELSANSSLSMKLNTRGSNLIQSKPQLSIEQLLALYESPQNKAHLPPSAYGGGETNRNRCNPKTAQVSVPLRESLKHHQPPSSMYIESHPSQRSHEACPPSNKKVLNGRKPSDDVSVESVATRNFEGFRGRKTTPKRSSEDDSPLDLSVKKRKSSDDPTSDGSASRREACLTRDGEQRSNLDSCRKSPPTFLTSPVHHSSMGNGADFAQSILTDSKTFEKPSHEASQQKPSNVARATSGDCMYGKFRFNRANKFKATKTELARPEQSRDWSCESNVPISDGTAPFVRLLPRSRDSQLPIERSVQIKRLRADIERCSVTTSSTPNKHRFHASPPQVSPDLNNTNRQIRHQDDPSLPLRRESPSAHNAPLEELKKPTSCASLERKSAFSRYATSGSPNIVRSTANGGRGPDLWSSLRSKAGSGDRSTSVNARRSPVVAKPPGHDAKELFSCLGDWSFVERGKYSAFGSPPQNNGSRTTTFVFDSLRSVSAKYDDKYLSTETKAILHRASADSKPDASPSEPRLDSRTCRMSGAKHSCPGCKQKHDRIPPIIDGFWELKKFNRYTSSTRPASPGVVYSCQIKSCAPTSSPTKRPGPHVSGSVSSSAPINADRTQSECNKSGNRATSNSILHSARIAGIINKRLQRLEKNDAVESDVVRKNDDVCDDDDDDDLLANNIEESSDEEETQPIRTKNKFEKNIPKSVAARRNASFKRQEMKRNSVLSNSIMSNRSNLDRSNLDRSNLMETTQNNLIQLILAQFLAREREEEVKEMHLSDLEISDDDESERSV